MSITTSTQATAPGHSSARPTSIGTEEIKARIEAMFAHDDESDSAAEESE